MKRIISALIALFMLFPAQSAVYAADNMQSGDVIYEDILPDKMLASSGVCGAKLTWNLNDSGVLTISGTGNMDNWPVPYYPGWYGVRSDIKSIVISKGVTSIGDWAFNGFNSLESVTIPDTVTTIGEGAFAHCEKLKNVVIPDSVASIDYGVFYGCTLLETVKFPSDYKTVPARTFYDCSALKNVELSDELTSIELDSFYGCSSLADFEIKPSVTSIGKRAFYNCASLTSAVIPNGITSISESAFYGCSGLKNLTVPNTVKTISNSAFNGCSSLSTVDLPNSVTSLGTYVFNGCTSLISVNIPTGISSLSEGVFANCTGLSQITIPDNVKTIGIYCFQNCSALNEIKLHSDVKTINKGAFQNCTLLENAELSEGLSTLGSAAFSGCSALKEIKIPGTVTGVGESAFANCLALENVTIGRGAAKISRSAFYKCTSLKTVVVPQSITYVGAYAFDSCTALENAIFLTKDAEFYDDVFNNCQNAVVYCYNGSTVETYAAANAVPYVNIDDLSGLLAPSESSASQGDKITFTAEAVNSIGTPLYKFYYEYNGKTVMLQDYSEKNTFELTFEKAGDYTVYAEISDLRGTPYKISEKYTVAENQEEEAVFVFKIENKNVLYYNQDMMIPTDMPAQYADGKTLVPLRVISLAAGITDLKFDSVTGKITFTGADGYLIELKMDSTVCTMTKDGVSGKISVAAPTYINGVAMLPLRDTTMLTGGSLKYDKSGYIVVSGSDINDDLTTYISKYESLIK